MRPVLRRLPIIAAAICVAAGGALYLGSGRLDSGSGEHALDIALLQQMLLSSQQTSIYRLIPDSVLTGFCWRTPDNTREGVFKDVNAGVAHWRDHAPRAAGQAQPMSDSTAVPAADDAYVQLSRHLERLSFEAKDYSFSGESGEIRGDIVVGGQRREVVMNITIPAKQENRYAHNMIELNASTELDAADLDIAVPANGARPFRLCITMQAVKESVLPDSTADRPLMLSHYY